jgi:hypothetical protein
VDKQSSSDGRLWLGANNSINELPVFEDEHGWNTLNLELSGRVGILIDVQLGDAVPTFRLCRKLFHDWAHHAAGSAPGSPAVEQDRLTNAALKYLLLEAGVSDNRRRRVLRYIYSLADVQWRATLTALRHMLSGTARIHAILSPTLTASYDEHDCLPSAVTMISIISEKFRKTVSPNPKCQYSDPMLGSFLGGRSAS